MTSDELRAIARVIRSGNVSYAYVDNALAFAAQFDSAADEIDRLTAEHEDRCDAALRMIDRLQARVAELEAPQDKWPVVDKRDGHIIGACPLCGCEYSIGEYEEGGK